MRRLAPRIVLLHCLAAGLFSGTSAAWAQESPLSSTPCTDEDGELRKGVQKRDFTKRLRGEISAWGGFFAGDLLSSSYDFGGAVAFYPFEDIGFEASLMVTPFRLAVEKPLTQFFSGQVFRSSWAYVIVGDVLWAPIHFKLRAGAHHIVHGDILLAVGAGDTVNDAAQGATFDVGIGLKLYLQKYVAIRFDLRDYMMITEAVGVERVSSNLTGTLGLSVFLPGPRK